jgi:hypothetical protein
MKKQKAEIVKNEKKVGLTIFILPGIFVILGLLSGNDAPFFYVTAGLLFVVVLHPFLEDNAFSTFPELTSKATLIEKMVEHRRASTNYFFSFELEDGYRILLKVNREIHGKLIEGEKGILIYKNNGEITKFMSFERNIEENEPD